MMGIALGYICVLCACLLLANFVFGRFNLGKPGNFLRKNYKYLSLVFFVLMLLHIALVLPVLRTRSAWVFYSGVAAAVVIVAFNYIMRKSPKAGLSLPRALAVVFIFCVAAHMTAYFIDFKNYIEKIQSISLGELDTSKVPDAEYIGDFDAGYIYARVKVTVLNGNIDRIDILEHRNERGSSAEQVVKQIVENQKFPVEAISGATNSSKVIKAAVQNALEKAGAAK